MSIEDRSAMVSLCLPRRDAPAHTAPVVEIHEDASCLLAGFIVKHKHQRCVVRATPAWVNDIVAKAMATRTSRRITEDQIMAVARGLKAKANELADVRCEKVRSSIEEPRSQGVRHKSLAEQGIW